MVEQMYRAARGVWRRGGTPLAFNPFLQWAPPGHFYSPLPNPADVDRRASTAQSLPGIDTRDGEQLALAQRLAQHPAPFTDEPGTHRYGFDNNYFGYADSSVLYALLREIRPRQIIEVGSGWSTAVMLDAMESWETPARVTCIEPFPDRLRTVLRPTDHLEILPQPVQQIPLERFAALQAHDLLFIDSSHVAKVGSDVVHLLTRVLPLLQPGVFVHIHDLFWPFDYPEDWLREGRAWNEAYMVHAFLQFNERFAIRWFTSYLEANHPDALHRALPLTAKDHGGSLYLQRL
jgi:predicted O-methyltransferase YrrM